MVVRSRALMFLALLVLALPASGHASREGKRQPPRPIAQGNTDWLRSMEASLGAVRTIDSTSAISSTAVLTGANLVGLAGWLIAFGCFFGFISVQLKLRRRQRLLERGSKPDIFLYTPKR